MGETVSYRRGAAIVAVCLLIPLAAAGQSPSATTPDLPPPPGALQRELDRQKIAPPPAARPAPGTNAVIQAKEPVPIPFELEGLYIVVQASIDGRAPLPFIFDTGGRNIVLPEVSKDWPAANSEGALIQGVGPKLEKANAIHVDSLRVGSVDLGKQAFLAYDLPNGIVDRGSRPKAAGLIGAELLNQFVVRIDFQHRLMTMFAPGQFHPPADGFSLPLSLLFSKDALTMPYIPGQFESVPGNFALDTGDAGEVTLSPRFDTDHGFFDRFAKIVEYRTPGGIGGRFRQKMALSGELTIGPVKAAPTVVHTHDKFEESGYFKTGDWQHDSYVSSRESQFDSSITEGRIGNSILSAFVTTFDFGDRRIYFQPVGEVRKPPAGKVFGPDISGPKLFSTGIIPDKPDHDHFEVVDVIAGTAAEREGVRPGDKIVSVAGKPARDLSLGDFVDLTNNPNAKHVVIEEPGSRRFDLAIEQILP
jgi:hypothetical protein